ncbi:MAG: DNA cytosine methyltransferase [Desulfobacteraceae bacterium]|nr:DNA cytosine methyltransferase [Desulfobacteraceae bacterium]
MTPPPRTLKYKAISLFTGAGGLDLGMEAAGFETCVAVEMDGDCVSTLRANRDWPVIPRSIHTITSDELLKTGGIEPGEADLLIGGPPCQPFSKAGYWASGDAKRLDDPRAGTVSAFLRVLRDTRPRAFLMENVTGLTFKGKDEGLRLILATIASINKSLCTSYTIKRLTLNAADFGVPQARERAFLVGSREGIDFGGLLPTHDFSQGQQEKTSSLFPDTLRPSRNAWDALWDLEEDDSPELLLRGKWADLLPSVPEGQNYLFHTDRGGGLPLFGWRRRFWNFLLKLAKEQPSWTLTAQPGPATGPFHWKNRRLSARELCRLQTIPDSFAVKGPLQAVQRQVGNAVPSALAEKLGLEIRCRFFQDEEAGREPRLIPRKQGQLPPPEPVRPVPQKYLQLVGQHAPHPGTGKGYQAQSREIAA